MNGSIRREGDEATLAPGEPLPRLLGPPADPCEERLEVDDIGRTLDETHLQRNARPDLRDRARRQIPLEERDRLPGDERPQAPTDDRAEDRARSGVGPDEPESVQVRVDTDK